MFVTVFLLLALFAVGYYLLAVREARKCRRCPFKGLCEELRKSGRDDVCSW